MRLFQVYVNDKLKWNRMADTRIMILTLKKSDDVDCIDDKTKDVQSFIAKQDGIYELKQSKEGVLSLKLLSE